MKRNKWLGNDIVAKTKKQVDNINNLKSVNKLIRRKLERLAREDYEVIITQRAMRKLEKDREKVRLEERQEKERTWF